MRVRLRHRCCCDSIPTGERKGGMVPTMIRRGLVPIAAVILGLVMLPHAPASAAITITPVRQVGSSGHAELYGWGAATFPDGTVAIGDYWNYRVQRYAKDGSPIGTVQARTGGFPHGAPYGLATDPVTGDLYVGNPDNGANVLKYSISGQPILSFGSPGSGANRFRYPRGVAVASDRTVFVADARDDTVSAHNSQGQELYSVSGSQVPNPRGIAVDAQDNVYVGDSQLRRVQVFNKNLQYQRSFGYGQLGGDVRGVAVDKANGWVYVVDAASGKVYKYTTGGTLLLSFGALGSGPGQFNGGGRDVTVDGDGNVWVGDMPNFRVQKFSPSGQFIAEIPDPPDPPPDGGFAEPRDVAVDSDGDVFVADTHNWRMQKFAPAGQFVTKWGNRATFNYQKGTMVDRVSGAVYVCDTDAGRLRKYDSSGTSQLWSRTGFKCFGGAVSNDGTSVYVADTQNARVVQVSAATGSTIRTIASRGSSNGQVQMPRDVAVAGDGTIWVSDSTRNTIQQFGANGGYLGRVGQSGSSTSSFRQAWGVAVAGSYVLVADSTANQIKIWTTSGTFVCAFGGGGSGLGQFQAPKGMDYNAGKLYVVEQTGERVQVLDVGLS
ncbi:MAG: hypothetical protein DYH08_12610 [Actinobacteria bacterium ATB1]|nr:hypothetical protein [Actinobacteria bacterium ATB1]